MVGLPSINEVHIDGPLSNVAVAYFVNPDMYVAGKVFPRVQVAKRSDKYFVFDRSYFFRDDAQKRAPGTRAVRSGYKISQDQYYCEEYAHEQGVPWEVERNADFPLQPEITAAKFVAGKILLKIEKDFFSTYFATGVWASEVEGVASAPGAGQTLQWDQANANPIVDIDDAKNAVIALTGFAPNTLTLSQEVWTALKNNPQVIDRLKYGQTAGKPAMANLENVAALLELDSIYVSKAIETTSKEGQATQTFAFIAGKHALLTYAPPAASIDAPSAGYTFDWNEQGQAGPVYVDRYDDKAHKENVVRAQGNFDHKVVARELGFFFENIVG